MAIGDGRAFWEVRMGGASLLGGSRKPTEKFSKFELFG